MHINNSALFNSVNKNEIFCIISSSQYRVGNRGFINKTIIKINKELPQQSETEVKTLIIRLLAQNFNK